MYLPFFIARRYLFSKKSHNAINIISAIAAAGIAIATAAMVCVLSVFNGFHDLIATLYCNFDPEIQVTVLRGKTFDTGRLTGEEEIHIIRRETEIGGFLVTAAPTTIKIAGVQHEFSPAGLSLGFQGRNCSRV